MRAKRIAILGSTGSIGINALRVAERFPGQLEVVALTAYNNITLLEKQVRAFLPRYVAASPAGIPRLRRAISRRRTKIYDVESELARIVTMPQVDIVVIGISGCAALVPFLAAVRSGKTVAPANKEALVIAGHIIMREARKHRATIVPVDSEQSAIFQCLQGQNRSDLQRVYLTGSGGPLRTVSKSRFNRVTVGEILKHPRWKMGKKITVDSATLMNKGFEAIEARWLFDLSMDDITVLIHPEAIVHSMVEFRDGSIIAQLGITDMRLPIQYALTYPERWQATAPRTDFCHLKKLTFLKPDFNKFPALRLCFSAGQKGGTMPCVLNAANEEAVNAFLNGRIRFSRIYTTVERVVRRHTTVPNPQMSDIWAADAWAREQARRYITH